jgi:hypothetical protein
MDDIASRAAEVLETAADAFESGRLNWVQDSLGSPVGNTACARGAVNHVLTGSQWGIHLADLWRARTPERQIAIMAEQAMGFEDSLATSPGSLPHWNDTPGRTVQEVIDRMKDGAKRLRNGEAA